MIRFYQKRKKSRGVTELGLEIRRITDHSISRISCHSRRFWNSLFQALCQCGRLKKRAGDERDLVEKEGTT